MNRTGSTMNRVGYVSFLLMYELSLFDMRLGQT